MSWNVTTGLDKDQLSGLVARVHRALVEEPGPPVAPARMWALGLYRSVVLVLFLLRQNPVQEAAAELFGVSQATVSRRWTALLPVVEKVLAGHVPDPAEASAGRVVLVDGTVRHEALDDRAGVRGPRHRAVAAAWLKPRAA
ncbi:transposase family protein [Streptomyces olivoreticuli]|uniref:helix-turn-helix domain-containing protein n=1 Tax=Streptomyces olivoreticuli TaxID=68246 RepID=UPI002659FDF7|nr:transposase family protein [Streptomyces olivoreticuli]WKK24194.1 transposase family protein [Streptomyces olivoreticuli]